MTPLSHLPSSAKLVELQKQLAGTHLRDLFDADKQRFDKYTMEAAGLFLDYSKNLINDDVLASLTKMAEEARLPEAIQAMFSGEKINNTEGRAVLHTALRYFGKDKIMVDGEDVMPMIRDTHKRMKEITQQVHNGEWKGHTGKASQAHRQHRYRWFLPGSENRDQRPDSIPR